MFIEVVHEPSVDSFTGLLQRLAWPRRRILAAGWRMPGDGLFVHEWRASRKFFDVVGGG